MDKREKKLITAFFLLVIVICGICIIMYCDQANISEIDVSQYEFANDVEYSIDRIEITEGKLVIEGWAFILGEEIHKVETYIILFDAEDNVYYQLPTEMELRTDITERRNDNINYDSCGFVSWSKITQIQSEKKYKICILYKNDGHKKLIKTDKEI